MSGEDTIANTFLPDDVDLSGDCSDEDTNSLTMKFKGFVLFMLFKKTPGGERWYVSNIELSFSSSNPLLEQADRPNLQVCNLSKFLMYLCQKFKNKRRNKKLLLDTLLKIFNCQSPLPPFLFLYYVIGRNS